MVGLHLLEAKIFNIFYSKASFSLMSGAHAVAEVPQCIQLCKSH